MVSIEDIATFTAKYFALEPRVLRGADRTRRAYQARQLAFLLCNEFTDATLEEIGGHFGGRNHTTVLASINTARQRKDIRARAFLGKARTHFRGQFEIAGGA